MNEIEKGAETISLFCRTNYKVNKEIPIRSSEMGLLILLVKSDVPVTSMVAAEFFKVSKPMITAMAQSLIKKQYIKKVQLNEDKRKFHLVPTKKAIQLVDETYTHYFKHLELLKTKMGDKDFCTLVELLSEANQILLEEINE